MSLQTLTGRPTTSTRQQLVLVVVSQVLSSASSFLAAIAAARWSSASEYGAIALLIGFYLVTVQLVRPFGGNVLQIVVSAAAADRRRAAELGIVRIAVTIACGCALVFVPVLLQLVDADARWALAGSAALVPLLVVHDTLRVWATSVERPVVAVILDAAWLVTFVAGLILLAWRGDRTGHGVILTWVISGSAVAAVAWIWREMRGRGHADWRVAWSESKRLGTVYAVDALLGAASTSGIVLLLPAVAGLGQIGRLRLLEMPFGVLTTLSQGLTLFLQPATRRWAASGRLGRAWRAVAASGTVLTVCAVAMGSAVLLVPRGILTDIFGPAFDPDGALVAAIVVKYGAFGVLLVASTMARSLGLRRETLGVTAAATLVAITVGLALCTRSLPLGYAVLYGILALGCGVVVLRVKRSAFSPHTV